MHKLIIFSTPHDTTCYLMLDNTTNIVGKPDVHRTGRKGIGFTIPDGAPDGNGARLFVERKDYVSIEQRGILLLNDDGTASFFVDDFYLQPVPKNPPPFNPPVDKPPVNEPNKKDPESIIKAVYDTKKFDLSTHEGCGKFTEACETALRTWHSKQWGHIRKRPGQNQYPKDNGHAVDALMLLVGLEEVDAGTYDIVFNTESPGARPQFLYKGPPVPEIWYHE